MAFLQQKDELENRIIEDVLKKHENYPFSKELKSFMINNKEFTKATKLYNSHSYYCLPFIITSSTPSFPEDEVIGIWFVNKTDKGPRYKQDFIVRKKESFVLYTSKHYARGKHVEPLKNFFEKYGENGKYYHSENRWQHHYKTLKDLPHPGLKELALKYQGETLHN